MTPLVAWTALITVLAVATACAAAALGVLVRRQTAWADAAGRRLDDLAARLVKLEARRERDRERTPRAASPPERPVPSGPHPAARRTVTVVSAATSLRAGPTGAVPSLIAVPDLSAPPLARDASPARGGGRYEAVWDLAAAGTAPSAIARSTGLPIGKVELILGLRRQGARPPGPGRGGNRPA